MMKVSMTLILCAFQPLEKLVLFSANYLLRNLAFWTRIVQMSREHSILALTGAIGCKFGGAVCCTFDSHVHPQYLLYQILRGLKYIHSASVLHRDLKPSNLLLNENCDLKICDFGLACTFSERVLNTESVVTRWYRAPEILLGSLDYNAAIDVWSVGCIFMEIMNRKTLFQGRDHRDQLCLVMELIGFPSDNDMEFLSENARRLLRQLPRFARQSFPEKFPHVPPLAIDLVEKMLTFDPRQRITVEDALAHPYLDIMHNADDEPVRSEPLSFDFEKNPWSID